MELRFYLYSIAAGMIGWCVVAASPVWAQSISSDETLSTDVTSPDGQNFTIDGGDRAGDNLFHSFKDFSVPTGGSAFFDNKLDVKNIIGRVTGGKVSDIDGLIRANGSANLFLLNPNGIVFGPNATLNIGGSFVGSTANSLKFSDGTEFNAKSESSPLLTISVPIGLQYGANSGQIKVQQSNLAVQPEQTLALVGGDVTLEGSNLTASSGRVELGAVAGGNVQLTNANNQLQLIFPAGIQTADITLTNAAKVSASGSGGGDIQLKGRQIEIDNSRVEANTQGSEPGGNITVNASTLELIGKEPGVLFDSGLFAEAEPGSTGSAGNLSITTSKLLMQGDSRISTATFGAGNGGNLSVNAADTVELIGVDPPNDETLGYLFTGMLTDAHSEGSAGDLTLNARRLVVRDGAQITATTLGTGNGGNLTVNAADSIEVIGVSPSDLLSSGLFNVVQPPASGNTGDIAVNTRQLILRDGGQISSGTVGIGNGGNLTVNAIDSIEATGTSPVLLFPSGLYSSTEDYALVAQGLSTGRAGNITIDTGRLILRDGAKVETASRGNAGAAGNLTVNATQFVELSGRGPADAPGGRTGLVSNTTNESIPGTGTVNASDAGNVTVITGRLSVQDGARIAVNEEGSGKGGELKITANSILLDNPTTPDNTGNLTAATASGEGGNIQLEVSDLLLLRRNSKISAEAGNNGNGGNIDIDTKLLAVLDNSEIIANAFRGQGGNIRIATRGLFQSANSRISASSQFGVDGVVEIQSPDVEPSEALINLPQEVVDVTGLVAQGCAAARQVASKSEFIVTGRGGLPPSPSSTLSNETILADLGSDVVQTASNNIDSTISNRSNSPAPTQIVEAQGWVVGANGGVLLIANAPAVTPNSPGLPNDAICSSR